MGLTKVKAIDLIKNKTVSLIALTLIVTHVVNVLGLQHGRHGNAKT